MARQCSGSTLRCLRQAMSKIRSTWTDWIVFAAKHVKDDPASLMRFRKNSWCNGLHPDGQRTEA
eukprot:2940034-Pyramimonas_sp.AAC.1